MKTCRSIFWRVLPVLLILGCSQQEILMEISPSREGELELYAQLVSEPQARTALQADGSSIWWEKDDAISVFYGKSHAGTFYNNSEQKAVKTTVFKGDLSLRPGQTGEEVGTSVYCAVYPADDFNRFDGEKATLFVKDMQTAREGGFGQACFPAVARFQNLDETLQFYNVCGGVRFSVAQEGIRSITIRSIGGEPLSGSIKVGFDAEGKPQVKELIEAIDSVLVLPPSTSTTVSFIPGVYYYVALLPQHLSSGLEIIYRKWEDNSFWKGTYSLKRELTVNRSRFGTLERREEGLTFHPAPAEPDDVLLFRDPWMRSIMIEHFDRNYDNKLTFEEVAAIGNESFNDCMKDEHSSLSSVRSFDEFQVFSSITEITEPYWFNYRYYGNYNEYYGIRDPEMRPSSLESITLPSTLRVIGEGAFYASKLISIDIPDSVVEIRDKAFAGCSHLQTVRLPSFIERLPNRLFGDCTQLTEIRIPSSVREFGRSLFSGCTSLKTVIFPAELQVIGDYMFNNCQSLSSVLIPNTVTRIGVQAFDKAGITEIVLPASVQEIGAGAFRGTSLTSIVIPHQVRTLDNKVFDSCQELKSVLMPEELERIGSAFIDCSALQSVSLPRGLKYMNSSFCSCTSLASISLPEGLIDLGQSTFMDCSSLASVNLPDGLTYIGANTFSGCTSLTSISLPNNLTRIEDRGFKGCSALTSLTIPAGVTELGRASLENCTGLQYIILLPETPPTAYDDTFNGTNGCFIYVPDSSLSAYKQDKMYQSVRNRIVSLSRFPLE